MGTSAPAVAVVIPCRNEALRIATLLDALAAQTCPPDDIVVVDDRSTDGTVAAVERWTAAHPGVPVRVVQGRGDGAGAAMNAGIAAAKAGVIVRLDGHSRPNPDYIARSIAALRDPRAGVAGGVWRILPGASTLQARGIAAVLSSPFASGGATYRARAVSGAPRPSDTVPFGAFRRDVWSEVGGFDESLLRNQDYDFNYRIRRRGYEVVLDPGIVSEYHARPTLRALWTQYFAYGYWKIVMLRKFPGSLRARQLAPLALLPALVVILYALVDGRTRPAALALAMYAGANLAAAAVACARAGAASATHIAAAALITLQCAWSAGAWKAILTGARAARR